MDFQILRYCGKLIPLAFITFLRGDLTFREDADFVLCFSFTYNSFRLPARLPGGV